jgi:hypothetical protein
MSNPIAWIRARVSADKINQWLALVANLAVIASIAQRANMNPAALTLEESQKVGQLYVSNLRLWENAAERNSWRTLGDRTPLLRGVYCQLKRAGSLSPAFVAEMDKLTYGEPSSCAFALDAFGPAAGTAQP